MQETSNDGAATIKAPPPRELFSSLNLNVECKVRFSPLWVETSRVWRTDRRADGRTSRGSGSGHFFTSSSSFQKENFRDEIEDFKKKEEEVKWVPIATDAHVETKGASLPPFFALWLSAA